MLDRLEVVCGVRPESWEEYEDAIQIMHAVLNEAEISSPAQVQQQPNSHQHTPIQPTPLNLDSVWD